MLALLVSSTTAYFSVVRQIDDIGLSIRSFPYMDTDPKTKQIRVQANNLTLAFTNRGNRPAAITAIKLYVIQPNNNGAGECAGSAYDLRMDTPPFVIKAGDIVVQHAKLKDDITLINNETGEVNTLVAACLGVDIVTPDNESANKLIELYRRPLTAGGWDMLRPFPQVKAPITLYFSASTVFGDSWKTFLPSWSFFKKLP